jgi:hypothetical protein
MDRQTKAESEIPDGNQQNQEHRKHRAGPQEFSINH